VPTLAFDTCLGAVSVALSWIDDRGQLCLEGRFELCRAGHAERLLPMIDSVLRDTGHAARAIDRIAVTLGPGTFTGVRTGIAAARAMALASGASVVGTTSLAVIAQQFMREGEIEEYTGCCTAVAVDARKGQMFLQLFGDDGTPLGSPELASIADASERLRGRRWRIAGSAAEGLAAAARAQGIEVVGVVPVVEPDARDLVALAPNLAPLSRIAPLYLRAPDAIVQAGKGLPRAAS